MTEQQPSLFPEQNGEQVDAQIIPFDQAAAAAHIAEHARPVDYEDRTSEAAKTQGWGPYVLPEADTEESEGTVNHAAEQVDTGGWHPSMGKKPQKNKDLRLVGIKPDPLPEHVETYHMNKHEIAELRAKLRDKGE